VVEVFGVIAEAVLARQFLSNPSIQLQPRLNKLNRKPGRHLPASMRPAGSNVRDVTRKILLLKNLQPQNAWPAMAAIIK